MRILFFSNVFPTPWQPTRGAFNLAMIESLRSAGHQVTVVVPVNVIERATASGRSDTRSIRDAAFLPYLAPPRILRAHYHQFIWFFVRRTLRRIAATAKPDVILSFWLHPDGAVAQRLGREIGVPVVPMAGGSDVLVITRDRARRDAVERVLRASPAVLTNGETLRSAVVGLGAPPERVFAFRRGVDATRYRRGDRTRDRAEREIPEDARVLLFVGNLVHVKGPDLLLDAVAACAAVAPWSVVWVGDGPDRAALEQRAVAAGLGPRMRFVGRIDRDELAGWYRSADYLVLPSRSEGIPNVLLEAMACGTPYLAFDVGGVREVTPDAAWLLPKEDVTALATALGQAYRVPRPAVPEISFDQGRMTDRIVEVLEVALASQNR